MKSPDHPTPSGDRHIAQGLMAALNRAGFQVDLACRFRAWEGRGDAAQQARLAWAGRWLADRLADRLAVRPVAERPRLWFTYHLYHKAPDWLGPAVSTRLGIPYAVAEASRALKQADGPWAPGFAAADAALARADRVFAMTARGARGLVPLTGPAGRGVLVRLAPFLADPLWGRETASNDRAAARAGLAERFGVRSDCPWLVTVAMMRPGDKLASYRLLGDALRPLTTRPWTLIVAGDGPARVESRAALAGLPVTWAGALDPVDLRLLYDASDLFVWPGLREGYGMVYLEAQARGLPVVACDSGGVADVVADGLGGRLVPEGDAEAFARAVTALLDDPAARVALGASGRARVRADHGLDAAARTLGDALRGLVA